MPSISNAARKFLRRNLEYLAASFGPHTRSAREPRLLILMYHRILPQHDERSLYEEPGMIVTPETFRLHITILKEYFDIVHLAEWINLKNSGSTLPKNACAITFDDGWADNHEFAYPVLKEQQTPATVFLVSNMIGTSQMFWPERLSRIMVELYNNKPSALSSPDLSWLNNLSSRPGLHDGHLTREMISALIADAKRYPDREIIEHIENIEKLLDMNHEQQQASLLNWQQVLEMTDSGLIDTGSHTCHHIRLDGNTPEDLMNEEIVESKKVIESRTGKAVKVFCYPNGDYSPRALQLVKEHYSGAVITTRGWNTAGNDAYMLKRIGIHQDISNNRIAFLSRTSGWI